MYPIGDLIRAQIRYLRNYQGIDPEILNLAARCLTLESKIPEFPHAFHNARQATYAGLQKECFWSELTVSRALDNLESGLELLTETEFYILFHTTTIRPAPIGEKMPEAAWLCPIFSSEAQPAARLGLNLHYEDSAPILTIANIQGKDNQAIAQLKQALGEGRIWPVEAVRELIEKLPSEIRTVRGLASTVHPARFREGFDKHRASCLYDRTFRNIGMQQVADSNGELQYYELTR